MKQADTRTYGDFSIRGMYLPWEDDALFKATYDTIKEHSATLVDVCRSYTLWDLAGQMVVHQEPFIEVGTWRGGTGCILAKRAMPTGNVVYLCDAFSGVVKAGPLDARYHGGEHSDAFVDDVQELADLMGLDNMQILQGIFPEETGHVVQEMKFGIAHIDVDTYQSAKDVFEWVWPRLVTGGVVVFDDYGMITCPGITALVDELKWYGVVAKNPAGQAIMVKI